MKKRTVRKSSRKSASRRAVQHHRSSARHGAWGKDGSMVLMLAAGTIVLVVIGMYMAGWL